MTKTAPNQYKTILDCSLMVLLCSRCAKPQKDQNKTFVNYFGTTMPAKLVESANKGKIPGKSI